MSMSHEYFVPNDVPRRQVASVLPVDARVLLYRGLSAFLMPPRLLEGDMARVS